ncbi:MAG TPA: methyltransferase domain-containing protein, partial [Opitutus sp.]|nr:methyltransferase domain-containing protein [Opitutus sp.]
GCGSGATEHALAARGACVTALPLDSIIGAAAAGERVEMIYGSLDESFHRLAGRQFDCVLMTNLLHLQREPSRLLRNCLNSVRAGGHLVLGGPNFDRLNWFIKRAVGLGAFSQLRDYEQSGISLCGPRTIAAPLRRARFEIEAVKWVDRLVQFPSRLGLPISLGQLTARSWILQARRGQA